MSTRNGLRRIEQGIKSITPKSWQVQVKKALTKEAVFEGASVRSHRLPDVISTPLET
ncbi:MAG TPA: hypothetical protein V6C91_11885 [Coleofasciculaceae cyanobacterium]